MKQLIIIFPNNEGQSLTVIGANKAGDHGEGLHVHCA